MNHKKAPSHKQALLLVNLGSPDSTDVGDVKRYLDEFLMDKYVIDLPYIFRWLLVKGIILNTRPKKSAEAYRKIWWEEGSPLLVLSKRLAQKVAQKLTMPVGLAMRYANPSIEEGIQKLVEENPDLKEIILFPLYPHYAMATTVTVVEKAKHVLNKQFPKLNYRVVPPFYNHPSYIQSLATIVKENTVNHEDNHEPNHVLFSFHGVPERHVMKTDCTKKHCMKINNCCYSPSSAHQYCYSHHVHQTAQLVAQKAGLVHNEWSISFQSRLGLDRWLSPATDTRIEELAKLGIKHLTILCPSFVSDCLETLEEIGQEGKEIFLENGGETFNLIPCLNDRNEWVDVVRELVQDIL